MEQKLGSAKLANGAVVAYSTAGSGPPLLFVGGWLSHLELSWALPPERAFLEGLARGRTLVRYDRPGCGLSGAVDPGERDLSLEFETIATVAAAVGASRFDVIGVSLGAPLAIAWAAENPGTVDRLVAYGGWVRGADLAPAPVREHLLGIIRSHWGLGADVITEIFAPDASPGTRRAFAEYQRQSSTAETAAQILELCYRVDVSDLVGQVTAPTLVLHREHDRASPITQGRLIASSIPGARMVEMPGRSHLPYVGNADSLVTEIRRFLQLPAMRRKATPTLTPRQREVAALVSQGLTNRDIGQRLSIGERSAEGHVERIRHRLGVRSRAQIAAWWAATDE